MSWVLAPIEKMENREKKHHHFVPQVYLNNFAHNVEQKGKEKKFFVATYDKNSQQENLKIDTEKICVKNKLYTLKAENKETKEKIENIYATTIEKDFNKVYKILTEKTKTSITLLERKMIILTILNFHFRNYFWLKTLNDFWCDMIRNFEEKNPVNIYTDKGEILFPFESKNTEEIIVDHKNNNRDIFNYVQNRKTLNLLKSHLQYLIFVDTDNSGTGFLTSDRPVLNDNVTGSFRMPINNDFLLTIIPNKENLKYNPFTLIRGNPYIDARFFNILQFESAERIIIGKNIDVLRKTKYDYNNTTSANTAH